MTNASFLPIAILTVLSLNGFSQSNAPATTAPATATTAPAATSPDTAKKNNPLPSVMAGVGVLYFNGNIGKGSGITAYTTIRGGYTIGVEERPVSFLGIQLDAMFGKLAASERSDTPSNNLNFQTNVMQFELTANLHLDGLLLKKDAPIAPYLYTGFSFMTYSKYTDLYDAAGQPYYYWTDGSIRDVPQNAYDVSTANASNNYHVVHRSYNYNTLVATGSTECVPIGLGVKVKLTDNIAVNVQAAYYFTFTNSLEVYSSVANGTAKDKYLYSFATIEYHFTRKQESHLDETRYQNVTMDNSFIQDTLKKNDKGISAADANRLDSLYNHRDTSAVDRSEAFNAHPTEGALKAQDQEEIKKSHDPNKVPPRFRPADKNHDGYISSQEITEAIDEFFDGTSTMTIADINGLIDYFFDQ